MMNTNVMISVECQCPFCGKLHEVEVNGQDYIDWQNGKLAQSAFPYLSPIEREQLISETCPTCQKQIFDLPPEGDEDADDEGPKFQMVYEDEDGLLYEFDGDFSEDDFFDLISDL